ncbi:MAG: hypothetical protein M3362_16315, partial [Acidobacteriota bacterium]|nr:hypothetical protein [Acidobacteriota bacterium]
MSNRNLISRIVIALVASLLLACSSFQGARAQSSAAPLTSQELVHLVYQLPGHPEKRDEVIEEIRRRGINFPLTDGMRSLVASKSGNDAVLRHTLEEADRRRLNPEAVTPPSAAEAKELLTKAQEATLEAAKTIPDFIVKQLIKRSEAREHTQNWRVVDHLT